jgi:hypothetical protein
MQLPYIWDFGDGTGQVGPIPASTGYTQNHTYANVGNYRVTLIAIDSASCNIRDTSYVTIKVGDLKANLQADITKLNPCAAFNYQLLIFRPLCQYDRLPILRSYGILRWFAKSGGVS